MAVTAHPCLLDIIPNIPESTQSGNFVAQGHLRGWPIGGLGLQLERIVRECIDMDQREDEHFDADQDVLYRQAEGRL